MGIELELIILLVVQAIGSSFFAKFEIETPPLKKAFKWLTIDAATIGLFYLIHHYAILFPVVIITIGIIVHVNICKKNGIDPLKSYSKEAGNVKNSRSDFAL